MNSLFSVKNDLSPLLKLAIPLVLTGIVLAFGGVWQLALLLVSYYCSYALDIKLSGGYSLCIELVG